MELKLSVSIGATLQVKNAKGEWDWIKPEVGAEVNLWENEIAAGNHQAIFAELWDTVVGPQFKNVVSELLAEPVEEGGEESEIESAEGTAPSQTAMTVSYADSLEDEY
jgi:hypothetical protein